MATRTRPAAAPAAEAKSTVKPRPRKRAPGAAIGAAKTTAVRLASIPPTEFYNSYIGREIVPGKSEFDVFDYAFAERHNVLIEGPTGPGKTSAVMAYAAKEQKAFYAVASNIGIEPSQLFGKHIPSPGGGFKWVDGPVTDLVRNGGVLLLNEVNFIPERVATVLFGLLDKRRSITLLDHEAEVIEAHPDLLIVADMNPDYEGTRPLNKAFRNRFAIQLFWDYDDKVEAALVKSDSLRDMAQQFRKAAAAGDFETPCATNMLMEFESICKAMGFEFAKSNFVNHFGSDERQAAGVVVETNRVNIEADMFPTSKKARASKAKKVAQPALPEPDVDRGQYLDTDPDTGEQILVDPEHGIYGRPDGWVYDDEDEDPSTGSLDSDDDDDEYFDEEDDEDEDA